MRLRKDAIWTAYNMENLIFYVFFGLSCLGILVLGYIVWQSVVDSLYWLFVLAGILPATVVCVLITAAAFSSREKF